MKTMTGSILRITILLLIIQLQLTSQNIGIGATHPTSNLHLKSTIQDNTALDLGFETGSIDPSNTSGDYDWFIIGTDGYNSAKSAKAPPLLFDQEKAVLSYGYSMALGKEITVSFDYKNVDPDDKVQFNITSDHFSFIPPVTTGWKSFSTTFVSQSKSDYLQFSVKANVDEAYPAVQIDNILITYQDGHVLRIEDGTEGEGHFLQSDAYGHTEWYDLRSEIIQTINDNSQNLSFNEVQNKLFIEGGNSVEISGLKNNGGNILQLAGSTIEGSPGMSLSLPSADPLVSPAFHFDATNHSMDWGITTEPIKGNHSTRWGKNTTATFAFATAFGKDNIASSYASTSWGSENISSGWRSTTWGISNEASEYESTSFGMNNLSSGALSTSWGEDNVASGIASLAFGFGNSALGVNGTTWGTGNMVDNTNSTAWGVLNEVTENEATAWGFSNNVNASRATAWGTNNLITNAASAATACGNANISEGIYSFVSGHENKVNTFCEVAFGRFNNSSVGDNDAWDSSDLLFTLGNGTSDTNRKNAITVFKNGNVGIGKDAPTYDLHLGADSAAKPGSSSWTVSSDRRLKKDIIGFTDGLDIVKAIEPVWFTYNGLADIPEGTYVGTIAQDLEEIAPYMVSEYTHKDAKGNSENYKAVNYGAMDFVLINAIKEQQEEITDLKSQIAEIMLLLESKNSKESAKIND